MIPVPIIAREAGCFEREDAAHFLLANGGDEPLEPRVGHAPGAGASEILVDNLDPMPLTVPLLLRQGIPASLAFEVLMDLRERRLTHLARI